MNKPQIFEKPAAPDSAPLVMNYPSKYDVSQDFFPVAIPIVSACLNDTAYCLDTTILPQVQESQQNGAVLVQLRLPVPLLPVR